MKSFIPMLLLLSVLVGCGVSSGSPTNVKPEYSVYGLYLSTLAGGSERLLGNADKEQEFLDFIKDNGFNYLIMYDLENLVADSTEADQLASLIHRAKTDYGVVQVGVALARAEAADNVVRYNSARAPSERIDVLNVEYEFWNQPDPEVAFETTIELLAYLEEVGQVYGLETEIYIGWISASEGKRLAQSVDRILVHFYRTTDEHIIEYGLERLEYLAAADTGVRIAPIFSNEGPENTNDVPFMGEWLETHPHDQAFSSWMAGYEALDADWKSHLEVMGATWFIYDKFLDLSHSGTADSR